MKVKENGGSEAFTTLSLMYQPHLRYVSEYLKWEAEKIQQGYLFPGRGYAKQGSKCENCQQIIVDKSLRLHPALCESCSSSKTQYEMSVYIPQ